MSKSNINENDFNVLVNLLSSEINNYLPRLFRRETAAWAALVIYLAITSSILNKVNEIRLFNDYVVSILVSLFLFFIMFIFFIYIHSQFASIYWGNAKNIIFKEIILTLLLKKENVSISNLLTEYKILTSNENIKKEVEIKLESIQPFRGQNHPLKILKLFWISVFYIIIKLGEDGFKKLPDKRNVQEAAIYSVLVLSTFISVFYINSEIVIKMIGYIYSHTFK